MGQVTHMPNSNCTLITLWHLDCFFLNNSFFKIIPVGPLSVSQCIVTNQANSKLLYFVSKCHCLVSQPMWDWIMRTRTTKYVQEGSEMIQFLINTWADKHFSRKFDKSRFLSKRKIMGKSVQVRLNKLFAYDCREAEMPCSQQWITQRVSSFLHSCPIVSIWVIMYVNVT